jgi:hypothetical protein
VRRRVRGAWAEGGMFEGDTSICMCVDEEEEEEEEEEKEEEEIMDLFIFNDTKEGGMFEGDTSCVG